MGFLDDPEAMALIEKIADFGDDIDGGMEYLSEHFEDVAEPSRSNIYSMLWERKDSMSEKAQTALAFLSFKCQAGRDRLTKNLDEAARKLPPGKLRRDMIGE